MGLLDRVASERKNMTWSFGGGEGFVEPLSWDLDQFRVGLLGNSTPDRERIENDFESYVEGAYKRDGIVYACVLTRHLIFSQAPPMWQQMRRGRPAQLFSSPALDLLRAPWPGGSSVDLLTRMEVDLSLAGNFYATLADNEGRVGRQATGPGRRISVMRPDWVTIIVSSRSGDPRAVDARAVGYLYEPPVTMGVGVQSGPVLLMPDEVCHYRLDPDPSARWRGMSWLTPVLREISADRAATSHKLKFFENGATLSHAVSLDKDVTSDQFKDFVELFKQAHRGTDNAYETLFLGGGADVTAIGTDMRQLDFKATQGAGETRIAAASGVGAIVAQFSEGMQGSSLNAGNYGAARRRAADVLFRRLWAGAFSALQTLVPAPDGARLWYDPDQVWFLQEDAKDAADIVAVQMNAIRQGTDAGFDPDSVVDAVASLDITRLTGNHSGLLSVQLQPPGTTTQDATDNDADRLPSSNGRTPAEV
jgi:hypothetical protein